MIMPVTLACIFPSMNYPHIRPCENRDAGTAPPIECAWGRLRSRKKPFSTRRSASLKLHDDSQGIRGTNHTHRPLVQHMRVDHGRFHVGMSKQRLYGANVLPGLQ